MGTRPIEIVMDVADPVRIAGWWAEALGWKPDLDPSESAVDPPEGSGWLPIVFVPVPEPKTAKNRVHLDLAGPEAAGQAPMLERLLAAGARPADIGQVTTGPDAVPWVVLADPEGNEFCVLDPREEYADAGPVGSLVIDALDPAGLAEFWSQATGWPVNSWKGSQAARLRSPSGTGPWLEFIPTTEPHTGKNRLHLDVAGWAGDDQDAEVERLLAAGARRIEVGQSASDHEVSWVVLADPEGNEFCVLSSRDG